MYEIVTAPLQPQTKLVSGRRLLPCRTCLALQLCASGSRIARLSCWLVSYRPLVNFFCGSLIPGV